MPSHNRYGDLSNVRYDPDMGEFLLRCPDCVSDGRCWWPLTLEFWNPRRSPGGKTMQRCRACDAERKSRLERERIVVDKEYAARRRASARAYYHENKDVIQPKSTIRNREWRARKREKAS